MRDINIDRIKGYLRNMVEKNASELNVIEKLIKIAIIFIVIFILTKIVNKIVKKDYKSKKESCQL